MPDRFLPRGSPYPVLLVSCILCRRLHRAVRALDDHPVCSTCQRCARAGTTAARGATR